MKSKQCCRCHKTALKIIANITATTTKSEPCLIRGHKLYIHTYVVMTRTAAATTIAKKILPLLSLDVVFVAETAAIPTT